MSELRIGHYMAINWPIGQFGSLIMGPIFCMLTFAVGWGGAWMLEAVVHCTTCVTYCYATVWLWLLIRRSQPGIIVLT